MKTNIDTILQPKSSPPPINGGKANITLSQVVTDRFNGSQTKDVPITLTRLPPTASYGNSRSGNWQAVSQNEKVEPGDILRITYTFRIPFFKKWQTEKFISQLQESENYKLLYWSMSEDEGRIWVEVKVIKPDFGVTAILVAVAVAAIGVGIGFWLTTESIEKLFDPFTEKGGLNFFPFIAAFAAFFIIPKIMAK